MHLTVLGSSVLFHASSTGTKVMATNPGDYHPISCSFHDLLEAHATSGKPVQIRFRDATGAEQACNAIIKDLFARDGVEYLLMSTGDTLRLDEIIEVNGARLADY
jgi:Rho-binding antiterminator